MDAIYISWNNACRMRITAGVETCEAHPNSMRGNQDAWLDCTDGYRLIIVADKTFSYAEIGTERGNCPAHHVASCRKEAVMILNGISAIARAHETKIVLQKKEAV